MDHIATSAYIHTRFLALGPRFGLVVIAQRRLSWLPRVAICTDFEIFEIPGETGDIWFLPSKGNYLLEIIFFPFSIPTLGI